MSKVTLKKGYTPPRQPVKTAIAKPDKGAGYTAPKQPVPKKDGPKT